MDNTGTFLEKPLAQNWVSYLWESEWITAVGGIIALSIATRLFSGFLSPPQTVEDGVETIPLVPYWFPILGHLIDLSFWPRRLFDWARDAYRGGAFALNLGGRTHDFIFDPSLASALLNDSHGVTDSNRATKHIMCATFGYPRAELDKYDAAMKELSACYKHILSEPSLSNMVEKTTEELKANINNLVTFSPSPVDQAIWERTTGVDVVENDNDQIVETDLL